MINVIFLLFQILVVVLGAGSIWFAVYHWQKKQYFRFGIWAMFAIHNALTLAEILFKF